MKTKCKSCLEIMSNYFISTFFFFSIIKFNYHIMYIVYNCGQIATCCTYRIERRVDIPIGAIGQRSFLEIDFDVVGRRGGGATALRLCGIQQHLERGNGMQLGCLLVHFAWNIIFVIVIVCWVVLNFFFFFFEEGVSIRFS